MSETTDASSTAPSEPESADSRLGGYPSLPADSDAPGESTASPQASSSATDAESPAPSVDVASAGTDADSDTRSDAGAKYPPAPDAGPDVEPEPEPAPDQQPDKPAGARWDEFGQYTTKVGDDLHQLAEDLGHTIEDLFGHNRTAIEQNAVAQGFPSSGNGEILGAGVVLSQPPE